METNKGDSFKVWVDWKRVNRKDFEITEQDKIVFRKPLSELSGNPNPELDEEGKPIYWVQMSW